MKKKLIEVALPLDAINAESAREKSIRHGHPSTLHLWWARRPLAAARAVIWSSLVDDPSSHPEEFPTEEAQAAERERLFAILCDLVKWENSNNESILAKAKAEILKSTDGKPPALLDPFAGGGAIPLEAQRLGLEAHASDLNPVAVMINKAMIEIPPKFAGKPPVNPDARAQLAAEWKGAAGLASDVRYYGEWMKQEAFKRIGHLYPKVKDEGGQERTVIAWIWVRTVKCPNPACGCEMPLASSFVLSKKKGKEAYVQPIIEGKNIRYEARYGKGAPESPKTGRGQFKCICCGESTKSEHIHTEFQAKRNNAQLIAIVTEGNGGRAYFSPYALQIETAKCSAPEWMPEAEMNQDCTDLISGRGYGFTHWHELFTPRQLTALTTFSALVGEAQAKAEADAIAAGLTDDGIGIADGGVGAKAYGQAVGVYLAFVVDKMADLGNALNGWEPNAQCPRHLFARQAIPMIWDYAESNIFSNSSGSWGIFLDNQMNSFSADSFCFVRDLEGKARQFDAQSDNGIRNIVISTDPPYYDNIGYADLSDFFYVWLRQSLKDTYPKLFKTVLVPKAEELVATPYRFNGSKVKAREFFENGMLKAFKQIFVYACNDIPVTVYYAYKQSEDDDNTNTASTGWETMLSAIIQAGFSVTGTWPVRTECSSRAVGQSTNALASSIVLVCRKRATNAPTSTRRDFINTLKRELKPALEKLQASNIAPVDLAQSAIGPGMAVFSRYSQVLEANGEPMRVRAALALINQELDAHFTESTAEMDKGSRFCYTLFEQSGFAQMDYGTAEVLAVKYNIGIQRLADQGALESGKGKVRLRQRDELPDPGARRDDDEVSVWLLAQQLARAMETGGIEAVAQLCAKRSGYMVEGAKHLIYCLYSICERKGWAQDAFAYNSLISEWQGVQDRAASYRTQRIEQTDFLNSL